MSGRRFSASGSGYRSIEPVGDGWDSDTYVRSGLEGVRDRCRSLGQAGHRGSVASRNPKATSTAPVTASTVRRIHVRRRSTSPAFATATA